MAVLHGSCSEDIAVTPQVLASNGTPPLNAPRSRFLFLDVCVPIRRYQLLHSTLCALFHDLIPNLSVFYDGICQRCIG
ncbi:hypothetical protein DPMN_146191 [Dreissena polymorpha]|uniref:Uncharacterized protein n=1 Tax=Dreissena polymorpha TaxID=45954 RepID=A0A9D4FBB7_DREPO|nr:hypothetical protein DPMN_146191 [Dreissena polymorpha]